MISSIVKKNKDVTLVHLGLFLHCQGCKFFRCQRLERPGNWPGFCLGDGFNTSHYIDSITFGDLVMSLESCHSCHVTSCDPCSYFVYLCMLFQYISMFPYQKLRRVCGRASISSGWDTENCPRLNILKSLTETDLHCCGLLWLSGYWIHLDTVDVNSTNNRPDEMI